jgi:hypothetical protein
LDHANYSGEGFVDKFESASPGANIIIGVNADKAGTFKMSIHYANSTGSTSTGSLLVNDANHRLVSFGKLSFPSLTDWDHWSNVSQTVTLTKGLNLITIVRNSNDTGAFNMDYLELKPISM